MDADQVQWGRILGLLLLAVTVAWTMITLAIDPVLLLGLGVGYGLGAYTVWTLRRD